MNQPHRRSRLLKEAPVSSVDDFSGEGVTPYVIAPVGGVQCEVTRGRVPRASHYLRTLWDFLDSAFPTAAARDPLSPMEFSCASTTDGFLPTTSPSTPQAMQAEDTSNLRRNDDFPSKKNNWKRHPKRHAAQGGRITQTKQKNTEDDERKRDKIFGNN